ncbi:helix-turn-helix transcriptional regulator [Candidatus Leptofilum sp.]|uniref:helix-turn-helix transcriptional regulator n=1 Tax=Candidatus Leptofilum sp. TaxID=3241576 RepID=UPI003B5A345B
MSDMKQGSKYFPLYSHLQQAAGQPVTLTFSQIEQLLRTNLPRSARGRAGWWSNRSKGAVQASAWMDAGYHVQSVDLAAETVHFAKAKLTYTVEKSGDTVLWNRGMIKALRQHMEMSQGELADELGVRQQTVSEWETGAYAPSRATSKHLGLVAERAGFAYEVGEERP